MRAAKAKALRKAVQFHPSEPRQYQATQGRRRVGKGAGNQPFDYFVTGTIKATGPRGAYQRVKRAMVLTEAVLRAAIMGARTNG